MTRDLTEKNQRDTWWVPPFLCQPLITATTLFQTINFLFRVARGYLLRRRFPFMKLSFVMKTSSDSIIFGTRNKEPLNYKSFFYYYFGSNRRKQLRETNDWRKPYFLWRCEYFHSPKIDFSVSTLPTIVTAHIFCVSRYASIALGARFKVINSLTMTNLTTPPNARLKCKKSDVIQSNPVYEHFINQEQQKNNIFMTTNR